MLTAWQLDHPEPEETEIESGDIFEAINLDFIVVCGNFVQRFDFICV